MELTVFAPRIADAALKADAFIKAHKPGAPVWYLNDEDFSLTASAFVNHLKERRPEVITYREGKGRTAALKWAVSAAGWPCDLIEVAEGPEPRIVIAASWVSPAAFDPEGAHP